MSQSVFSAGAVAAATEVARRLGVGRVNPVVLHTSQHVSIRLLPTSLVARVVRDEAQSLDRLRRELAVGQHLAERGAPSVGLAAGVPPGPHFSDGFAMTFWEFVRHVPADEDNAEHTARAAAALSHVHQALADFPSELPNFWAKIDQCRNLLQTPSALPALAPGDRQFLLSVYRSLRTALDRLPMRLVPILGDAHLGNVFITSDARCGTISRMRASARANGTSAFCPSRNWLRSSRSTTTLSWSLAICVACAFRSGVALSPTFLKSAKPRNITSAICESRRPRGGSHEHVSAPSAGGRSFGGTLYSSIARLIALSASGAPRMKQTSFCLDAR